MPLPPPTLGQLVADQGGRRQWAPPYARSARPAGIAQPSRRACACAATSVPGLGRPPVDKELDRYAQPDGHGQYGILDDDGQTVLCHECGRRYRSLGAHVFRAHGTTADEYKAAHGLARSRGLASSALREALAARSAQQVGTPAWKRFEAARDPQAAADARTFPPSPAEARRAQVETATLNSRRARRPVVRTCPECGVQWCPLPGGYTRTTCRAPECVRAHAAEATRARARRQEEAIRPLTDDERESLRRLTGSDLMALVRRLLDEGMRQRTLMRRRRDQRSRSVPVPERSPRSRHRPVTPGPDRHDLTCRSQAFGWLRPGPARCRPSRSSMTTGGQVTVSWR